jgi:integrase
LYARYLYATGRSSLRPGLAVALNIEDLVKDAAASRIHVVEDGVLRSSEATQYRPRPFLLSPRTREAIADYLKVARTDGWLEDPKRLEARSGSPRTIAAPSSACLSEPPCRPGTRSRKA